MAKPKSKQSPPPKQLPELIEPVLEQDDEMAIKIGSREETLAALEQEIAAQNARILRRE